MMPDICDYEDSTYRTDFWEGQNRDYEDRVERIALHRLMPKSGHRLLELGAGFGRLTNEFEAYDQVVLLDYSRSQLEYARQQYGDDGFIYVAANIYQMPFAPGLFDVATMIRVLHHMQEPAKALLAVRDIMGADGVFILEYANKQNIKAIARWLLRQQTWSPFEQEPVEFVTLNYNFHPKHVRTLLREVGFEPGRQLTVSHFRMDVLKRLVPAGILATLDAGAQLTGNLWQLAPSVFTQSRAAGDTVETPVDAFWKCPTCGSLALSETVNSVDCEECGTRWAIVNGVYDFKEPIKKGGQLEADHPVS
ncbi:MAG: class I SAM-dependent methyltransferase [Anaerolineae bacterium]